LNKGRLLQGSILMRKAAEQSQCNGNDSPSVAIQCMHPLHQGWVLLGVPKSVPETGCSRSRHRTRRKLYLQAVGTVKISHNEAYANEKPTWLFTLAPIRGPSEYFEPTDRVALSYGHSDEHVLQRDLLTL
jgi:hypothetical protein